MCGEECVDMTGKARVKFQVRVDTYICQVDHLVTTPQFVCCRAISNAHSVAIDVDLCRMERRISHKACGCTTACECGVPVAPNAQIGSAVLVSFSNVHFMNGECFHALLRTSFSRPSP